MKSYIYNIKQVKTYLKKYFIDMILLAFLLITVIYQYGKPGLNVNDYYFASRQTFEIIGEKFYGKKNYYIIKNSDGVKYLADKKNLNSHIQNDIEPDISFGVYEDIGVRNISGINKDISITKDISTSYDSDINYGDIFVSDIVCIPFKKAGLRGEYNELKYFYSQGIFSKAEVSNIRKLKNGSEWKELPRAIRSSISEMINKYPEETGNFLNRMIFGNSYADLLSSCKSRGIENIEYEKGHVNRNSIDRNSIDRNSIDGNSVDDSYTDKGCEDANDINANNINKNDIIEKMKSLGISHLLAVSGLHINFLYSFLIIILSFIPVSRGKLDTICIGILLFYAWLLDFSASIVRVVLFITIRQLSGHFKFNVLRRRRVLFCLDLILFFQPYRIYDMGFRLSFLASMAIDFTGYLQKIKPIENRWLKNIRLTFWINIFTLPFIVDSIGEVGVSGFIGNLLILPIYSLIFIMGVFSILFQLAPGVDVIARLIFSFLYKLFSYLINGLAIIPFPKYRIIGGVGENEIIIYYVFVLITCLIVSKRITANNIFTKSTLISGRKLYKQKVIYFKTMAAVALLIYFNSFFIPYAPTLTMLDIGQGDSFLFSYKGINFLFDTGGEIRWHSRKSKNGGIDSGAGNSDADSGGKENEAEQGDLLAKELERRGVRKLDAVFISHRDYDHVGNLKKLSEYIEIDRIYCSYKKDGTIPIEYFDERLEEKIVCLNTGDEISACDNKVNIRIIDAGKYDSEDANSDAMILVLDYGLKILFTGDRKISDFPDLREVGDLDILKVAHHGSKTGTGKDVLESITPEIALISCGMGNMYGHPHKSVIDNLEKNSINIYRTDFDGTVELKLLKSILGEQYLSVKTTY